MARSEGEPTRPSAPSRVKPGPFRGLPRYAIVGASGVVVNLVVLWVVHSMLDAPFIVASAVATQTAVVTNYLGNELWTFHRRQLAWVRFWRFELASLAGILLTVTVASVLVSRFPPTAAQLGGIVVGASVNYGLNYWWTWRD